jgi:eukaryotic-like serine/threonine-protein kinase
MALSPGTRLGHYEILAMVGAGGMGEVYRARDARLSRDVAIKIIKPDLLASGNAIARFRREARSFASLSHPNIATLYEFGDHQDIHFLVMEYLDGESLAVRLARGGAIPVPESVEIASEIADALRHAHERGVLHRDLKPANIILTKGSAKLLDFGLAKPVAVDETASTQTPISGKDAILGTYQYMAPEVLSGLEADVRSDIFALGAVMFEMMTGQKPFGGTTFATIVSAILHDVPPPVSRLQPRASQGVDRIVRNCLARDPADRWSTAAQVRDQLRAAAGNATRAQMTRLTPRAKPWIAFRKRTPNQGLAVLPLRNLSADAAEEYFTDGMTESLITSLAKIAALKVIARTSVIGYKNSGKSLRSIAKELKVDTILEGSVARHVDRIRINLQLVRVASDSPVWAEQYTRNLTDVLDVQNEIAQAVAEAIRVTVSPDEKARLQIGRQIVPGAHDEYLKGQFAYARETKDGLAQSHEHFSRAIALDPGHALARVGLARYYDSAGLYRLIPYREAFANAREAASGAINVDQTHAAAFGALGSITLHEWNVSGAVRAFSRALDLDRNDSLTHREYARLCLYAKRFAEAIDHIEMAQELDPRSPGSNSAGAAVFYVAGDFRSAISSAERAIELAPSSPIAQYYRSRALGELGEWESAREGMRRAVELSGRQPSTLSGLIYTYARSGWKDEASRVFAELVQRSDDGEVSTYHLAEGHVAVGNNDLAMKCLEEAYEQRDPELLALGVDPIFADLRLLPAFDDLVERIGV